MSSTKSEDNDLHPLKNFRYDLPAGLVVFLVALPLCLGIAVASGAPPISGLIAGICGGLVVPIISRSPLSVSGPAAGLTAIVLAGISDLGGFEQFLEDVGTMISAGLDRKAAIRAITMHPAGFLGLADRVGTLAEGRRANLVVFSGDPFQPGTEIDGVMLDGRFVTGDIDQ